MKIKLNETLKGIDGKQLLDDIEIPGKKLTLKSKIITSLLTPQQEDKEADKWSKYEIFKKVRDAKTEVELTAEEVTIVKKVIGKTQPVLILGQCFELIEGK